MTVLIENCTLFDGEKTHYKARLAFVEGKVIDPNQAGTCQTIDFAGDWLVPGFIDIQVNGGGGVMLNDQPNAEAIQTIASAHRRYGTTSMLPTLITDSAEKMLALADVYRHSAAELPSVLGIHYEGPHINPEKSGVHEIRFMRPLDDATRISCRKVLDAGGSCLVTLAPEKLSIDDINDLSAMGCIVFAGHTNATVDIIRQAQANGLDGFTHLHNAMRAILNREPGAVGAALTSDCWCSIIVDGHHLHPDIVRLTLSARQDHNKMILVTDAMGTVGATKKSFSLYGNTIHAVDGKCATEDGTLAGSDLDMISAVKNTVNQGQVSIETALKMASANPAKLLKREDLGHLKPGARADMVRLTPSLYVKSTWVQGEAEHY
ncbi:MAG: N-acetylglucosamine-6-phosphate deacetylase [Gammaproteobacteria bacterium]|nr:N-acetylglucosamine-6-phosphate deacetylase [Gammaproteobacteria bacterium]